MLLHFQKPKCTCHQGYNLHQKTVPLLQSMFASLFNPYLLTKSSLQYPLYLSSFQTSLLLPTPIPIIYTKIFSLTQPFCYFSLRQRTKELGNLVRSDTILIFYFFLKVSKVIAGLTITDFFLLRLGILMYCWCIKSSNPTHLIPSIYCHYFQTLLIPPQEFTFF